MGAIRDVYEEVTDDADAAVEFEEFEAAVKEKVEQMGGLADEETAAKLVAHELADAGGEVSGIADIEPGMDEVKFVAKVTSVGEVRTFERDGEDAEEGRVVNVEVADETGQIRITFWDERAAAVSEELEIGEVLRIAGRPKEGYNGVEVNVDRADPDDADVDVQVLDTYRVEDLSLGVSDVDLRGRVLATDSVRTFDRDDGSEGRVSNLVVGDPTGRIRVTLWDEKADLAGEFEVGQSVEVVDGYVRERDGDLELHVGNRGSVEAIDEEIQYVPETTPISELALDDTVDIAGGVIEIDDKRTFDRDDGSQGQVRNIRVKDDTGDVRVALWGEKADVDVDLGQYVVLTDVGIQEGWQEPVEASANWRSTVSVLDERPDDAGNGTGSSAAPSTTAESGQGGLSSFTGGDGGATDEGSAQPAAAGGASGGDSVAATVAADDPAEGDEIEFTGTVVQAGSPVVLDDGTETHSVETEETLRLGEEVTVRGTLRDGRIDADDVF